MGTDIGVGIQAALPTSDVALGGRALTVAHGWQRWRHHATVLTGVILGILSSISSIAAGALGVAVLLFLYPSLPMRNIVGIDLAHAMPLTAVAGLVHMHIGSVDYGILATFYWYWVHYLASTWAVR